MSPDPAVAVGQGGKNGRANVGNSGPGLDAAACGVATFRLTKIIPNLLVILDRSASMREHAPSQALSKWEDMSAAINQVVGQTQASIHWGLKYFPVDDICAVDEGPTVGVAPMNASMIGTSIAATAPGGRTPTRRAVQNGAAYLAALKETNPRYILLATDGQPNCADTGVGESVPDAVGAIQAVAAAAAIGIPTFVIGVATEGDPASLTLSQMATAGQRPRAANPRYYPVASRSDLVATLDSIGDAIASCSFGLGAVPPDPTNIAVLADGVRVGKDPTHMDGWDYGIGETSIQLFGHWCDNAKTATITDVKAIFGCPGVVIP